MGGMASNPSDAPLQILSALEVLEAIARDRTLLSALAEAERNRLMAAAGRVASPTEKDLRRARKAEKKAKEQSRSEADRALLARTRMQKLRNELVFPTPEPDEEPGTPAPERLSEARACYVCKTPYHEVHSFYDSLCRPCGDFNFAKRGQTADLRGRVALVTGARVKIGYHAAIKLLRAGAHVIATTRFPRDAASRFAREPDHLEFRDRLEIHGLELRHTPSVELFARSLLSRLERLDFIVNNACQTVRRPAAFYRHLLDAELEGPDALPRLEAGWLRHHLARAGGAPSHSAALATAPGELEDSRIFPAGQLDADLQQLDLRALNSWRLTLSEVPTIELLEVQLVNAVAPFVLNARLKPLMVRVPSRDKHVVNVSAMEGQFYKAFKTDRHPHTNMAKAALNMLTRTSAIDYARDGIHMNSVDTGWVTDEDPVAFAEKKSREQGQVFRPPLDVVDGAARILDPIFDGITTGKHVFGQFLKDYRSVPW
ncbi:MAG: SDR family oxidoreductase [Deltaproteobacteria bacterium]|nr:SDR family oxidoreductase [Deltaproteobacteria bacterium]